MVFIKITELIPATIQEHQIQAAVIQLMRNYKIAVYSAKPVLMEAVML